jgi:photosystem II stability/assembly factor-like uncharacterized protein
MATLGSRKSLFCLLLLLSLGAHAQTATVPIATVPTDGVDLVGELQAPPSTLLLPDNDVSDRIQAQIDKFGGPLSEADKQALLSSLLQQKQTYGSQFGGNIPPKGMPVWNSIGPDSAKYETNGLTQEVSDSGRVRTILQSPTDEDTVFVLSAGGGLWKTTTFTHTKPQWQAKTDNLLSTSGGSVAFGRTANTLYLGLGDPFDYFPHLGGFITRSDDGGDTWTPLASLAGASSVRDVKVDTSGPADILLVATDVGLFRSTDGGATLTKVANIPGQGFWSIVQTSAGWLARSGAVTTTAIGQLLLSTDHGASWSVTGTGLTNAGRATLAVATPGDAVVFAFAASPTGFSQRDLFRSDDGGLHWIALNITGKIPVSANGFQPNMNLMGVQAYYNQLILVDPGDSTRRTIYLGGQLATAKTVDGGATWTLITTWFPIPGSPFDNLPYVHADCHFATMGSIGGAKTLMFGTDGGLFVSSDAGATWDFSKNKGIVSMMTQTVASSTKNSQSVISGLQDNGSRARLGASDVFNEIDGGDGEGVGWSQANNNFTVASHPNFIDSLTGVQPSTQSTLLARYYFPSGYFFTPIVTPTAAFDPTGGIFLSAIRQGVIITFDGGQSWGYFARIGFRIPAGFAFREGWNFMGLNTGPDGLAIAGTTGRVAVTVDYVHYAVRTILCPATNCVPGFPGFISTPVWAPGSVLYVASETTIPGSVRVVRSADLGVTWTAAGNGLPDAPVYSLAADLRDGSGNTMYAGTNVGVYVTTDGGANWRLFGAGLPTTAVTSLSIDSAGSVLRAALNGRGIWEVKP